MVQSIRYKVPAWSQTWLNQIAINYISRCKYSVKYRPGYRWDPREKENETRDSTIAGFPPNSESHAFYATLFSRLCNFVRLIRDGSFVYGFLSLSRFRRTFGNTATVADDFSASQVSLLYSRGTRARNNDPNLLTSYPALFLPRPERKCLRRWPVGYKGLTIYLRVRGFMRRTARKTSRRPDGILLNVRSALHSRARELTPVERE